MSEVTTIGLDIAKQVFHAHEADAAGRAVFSRRLTRGKLLDFFAAHPRCLVALEGLGRRGRYRPDPVNRKALDSEISADQEG